MQTRELTADNFAESIRLKVKPEQEGFVAANAASIAQSKFHTFLECYGVCDGDEVMRFSTCSVNPEGGTAWIVRPMVAAQFHGKAYGRHGLRRRRCFAPPPPSTPGCLAARG